MHIHKHKTKMDDNNVCVECLYRENDSLYKKYSEGNLRLTRCRRCGDFVDRYVEYDNVLIVLDLVLHKNPAYRHLLFNDKKFALHNRNTNQLNKPALYLLLRISFLLIFLDTWTKVIAIKTTASTTTSDSHNLYDFNFGNNNNNTRFNIIDSLTSWSVVYHYMLCFTLATLENLLNVSVLVFCCRLAYSSGLVQQIEGSDALFVGKAFIISSFCRPMILLFIIWDYPPDFIHVLNLFAMTQCVAALSATFNDSIALPCIIACIAFLCRNLGQVAFHMLFGLPSTFSTAYSPW
jgi:hypothetical protein